MQPVLRDWCDAVAALPGLPPPLYRHNLGPRTAPLRVQSQGEAQEPHSTPRLQPDGDNEYGAGAQPAQGTGWAQQDGQQQLLDEQQQAEQQFWGLRLTGGACHQVLCGFQHITEKPSFWISKTYFQKQPGNQEDSWC